MTVKNTHFLKVLLFSLLALMSFPGTASSRIVDSLNADYTNVPEIRTKKDKALRVLRTGAIVTTVGVSCIVLGVYGISHTPSEVFPVHAIGAGLICMTVTTIGLSVSIVGIVKVVKEHRRKKYADTNI